MLEQPQAGQVQGVPTIHTFSLEIVIITSGKSGAKLHDCANVNIVILSRYTPHVKHSNFSSLFHQVIRGLSISA